MSALARFLARRIARYQARGGGARFNVQCNFEPSCSEYARQALLEHGTARGLRLAFARLCRCRERDAVAVRRDPVPPRG
jgi:putative component of membrane protein insertase Oxa1/YidC/SpoIIIJ protein YidD